MTTALIVPVMKNFKGFAELMASVNTPVLPIIIPNWKVNIGVGPAWNEGLRRAIAAECEFAVIVNDDVILHDGLITKMTDNLTDQVVLVSPTNVTGVCHPRGLNFWCFALEPKKFVDRFGFFDENFAPAYFEDDDMAQRIRLGGGAIRTLEDRAYHQVMGTQSMDPEPVVNRDVWDRNERYYAEKWGGGGGNERFYVPFNNDRMTIKDW